MTLLLQNAKISDSSTDCVPKVVGQEAKEESRFWLNLAKNEIFDPEKDTIDEIYCEKFADLKSWLKTIRNESFWRIYAAENGDFEPLDKDKPKLNIVIPNINDRRGIITAYYEISGSKNEVLLKG